MMKKYVDEKYADIILQLAWKYINENPSQKGSRLYSAMGRTLETMDKYVANINRMGYMMYTDSISAMMDYICLLADTDCGVDSDMLQRVYNHLKSL